LFPEEEKWFLPIEGYEKELENRISHLPATERIIEEIERKK